MGRHRRSTVDSTIAKYIRSLFAKQAIITAMILLVISAVVFIASVKFSTDSHMKIICNKLDDSARILVETAHLENYKGFFAETTLRLEKQLGISNVEVVRTAPPLAWNHYSLGSCTMHWQPNLRVAFYSPSYWLGQTIYVRGIIAPRLIRSDLILFMLAICIILVSSYFWGSRWLLRNIKREISDPIGEMWESLRTGGEPTNLELHEIRNLWESLIEYKQLLGLRNSMWIAKEYYHEVKSPAFYQYNQLKRLTIIDDPVRQKALVTETLAKADRLIAQMEKALKTIASDDFATNREVVDLAALIRRKDAKNSNTAPVKIMGSKLLVRTLLNNLYRNAVQACGDLRLVETTLTDGPDEVTLSIKNPVEMGYKVDIKKLFVSDYSGKAHGTGMGLSLCRHIMGMHGGQIDAEFRPEQSSFEVIARFPKGGSFELATQQNGLPS